MHSRLSLTMSDFQSVAIGYMACDVFKAEPLDLVAPGLILYHAPILTEYSKVESVVDGGKHDVWRLACDE